MRWRTSEQKLKDHNEKMLKWQNAQEEPEIWFAWFPVEIEDKWVWLEKVYRERDLDYEFLSPKYVKGYCYYGIEDGRIKH